MAVGVGVVVLRAGSRRDEPQPEPEPPELGLFAGEPLARALRRMAVEQTDLAIGLLTGTEGALAPEAVHDIRKALKRLRALLRLLVGALGDKTVARENAVLRDLGRRLAGARDAEVMLDTLRALVARHPRKLGRKGIARLERRLLLEREGVRARALTDTALRGEVLAELRAFRARAAAWRLHEHDGARIVEPGLRNIYETGRRRYRRAERGKGKRTRTLHVWRKAVKDLRYASEILGPRRTRARRPGSALAPGAGSAPGIAGVHGSAGAQGATGAPGAAGAPGIPAGAGANGARHVPAGFVAPRSGRRRDGRRMRRLARRADKVAEALGAEHDLALLGELVSSGRSPLGVRLSRRNRRRLLRAIAGRRRELRLRALRAGNDLYDRSPKRMAALVRADRARRVS